MRDYLAYLFVAAFVKLLGWMPRRLALALTDTIALCAFLLDVRHRQVMLRNLEIAFPDMPERGRKRIARRAFRNLGLLAVEFSRLPKLKRDNISKLVSYRGFENFKRAYDKGRGVLYLTGHFSSWELLPFAHALYGYPLSFLVRPLDNKYLDAFFNRYRALSGNIPVPKYNSTRRILETLRRGGCVGILIDQNVSPGEGVFVEFFGRPALTTTGLALLALRSGAAVIPGYLVGDGKGRYHIIFMPELELIRTGDLKRDIRENTQLFTRVIEGWIRQHPEQWLWGHRRWKSRPPSDPHPVY